VQRSGAPALLRCGMPPVVLPFAVLICPRPAPTLGFTHLA